jgi:hypothetical protein
MSYVDAHSSFAAAAEPVQAVLPAADAFGPTYPALASCAKFRRMRDPSAEQRKAHGEAVMAGIRSLQAGELARETKTHRPNCPSRSAETTGKGIMKAVQRQHASQLQAGANADRARRTDAQIIEAYAEAMAEKRQREAVEAVASATLASATPMPAEPVEPVASLFDAIEPCEATARFLKRLERDAADHATAGTIDPRAAERAAWDDAQAAEIKRDESEPSELAYPDADDCDGASPCGGATPPCKGEVTLREFITARVGPGWTVHTRISAKARREQPNPIRRAAYLAMEAEFCARTSALVPLGEAGQGSTVSDQQDDPREPSTSPAEPLSAARAPLQILLNSVRTAAQRPLHVVAAPGLPRVGEKSQDHAGVSRAADEGENHGKIPEGRRAHDQCATGRTDAAPMGRLGRHDHSIGPDHHIYDGGRLWLGHRDHEGRVRWHGEGGGRYEGRDAIAAGARDPAACIGAVGAPRAYPGVGAPFPRHGQAWLVSAVSQHNRSMTL